MGIGMGSVQEPTESGNQPITARYLGHVTDNQPITDRNFLIRITVVGRLMGHYLKPCYFLIHLTQLDQSFNRLQRHRMSLQNLFVTGDRGPLNSCEVTSLKLPCFKKIGHRLR